MPSQPPDNVWVSREEYDRLQRQASQASPNPVVSSSQATEQPATVKPIQVIIGVLIAIGLFLSMTSRFYNVISVPVLLILIIFGAKSFYDFKQAKVADTSNLSANTAAIKNSRKVISPYRTLLIILLCLLAAPVVYIGGIIILFMILLAGGGGQSS